MLYEVIIPNRSSMIVNAESALAAKNSIEGNSVMVKAVKVNAEPLEVNCHPLNDDEVFQQYIGKDIVIYDEHHGTAARIRKASVAVIRYYLDEYSTVIVLN